MEELGDPIKEGVISILVQVSNSLLPTIIKEITMQQVVITLMTLIFQMIMESQIITELVKMMNSISNLEDREKKKVNKKKFQIKIMEVGLVIYLILIFLKVNQQKIKINKTIKHKIKAILICLEDHLILCKKLKTN